MSRSAIPALVFLISIVVASDLRVSAAAVEGEKVMR